MKTTLAIALTALGLFTSGCELFDNSQTTNNETYTSGQDGTVIVQDGPATATNTDTHNQDTAPAAQGGN